MKKLYFLGILAALVLAGCGESLEDTYSEHSGDGPIRYVGKVKELRVSPDWKSINVSWQNAQDQTVDKIKVVWALEGVRDSVMLDAGTTSYSIPLEQDGTYMVEVSSVDKAGNTSLVEYRYEDPITLNHPLVLSYTKGIGKTFFLDDHDALVLFMGTWNEGIVDFHLEYTKASGGTGTFTLDKDAFDRKYLLVEDIDLDPMKPVLLQRKANIGVEGVDENGDDIIYEVEVTFGPVEIKPFVSFKEEFSSVVFAKYGVTPNDFTGNTLELDHTITSIEDILYMDLDKLVLGGNRYLSGVYENESAKNTAEEDARFYVSGASAAEKLDALKRNIFVLDVAARIMGVEIDRYYNFYTSISELSGLDKGKLRTYFGGTIPTPYTDKGYATQPEITPLDTSDWTIESSVYDEVGAATLGNLLDNDPATAWAPDASSEIRKHALTIDMLESQTVNGIKIGQLTWGASPPTSFWKAYVPPFVKIELSNDKTNWTSASYVENIQVGRTRSEVALVYLPTPGDYRYVRVTVDDVKSGTTCKVYLADITVF